MIYIQFINQYYENYNSINKNEKEIFYKIKFIIIHFLYENPISVIDIKDLINHLNDLNNKF